MDNHFFAYLYRLRYIERWSLMRNVVRENVAEHSYHVALLAHALGTIAREVLHRHDGPDPAELAVRALFHDASEVFTGDIPTPVKHHNQEILHNFREIERLSAERLTNLVPDALREVYAPLLQGKTSSSKDDVYRYVKAADLLDAYLKCATELTAGNREFVVAKQQIEAALVALKMPEVEYFLTHLAPSVEKTLDELS
jgi:5'-deoxynucleotidase